jgi:peptide deformylase
VLREAEGDALGREGCLSLPDITANVRRATRVVVETTGLDGRRASVEAEGFEARVVLHEMDHLDGVLILDRTTREQRKEAMRTLRETVPMPLHAAS